jgi:hypothetical protein
MSGLLATSGSVFALSERFTIVVSLNPNLAKIKPPLWSFARKACRKLLGDQVFVTFRTTWHGACYQTAARW